MRFVLPGVLYFIVVIFVAHFYAPPGYLWQQNTISDLGSQGHPNKWIMQAGFIGFGVLLAGGITWKSIIFGKISYPDLLILLYGCSVLVTGFYCAEPIDPSHNYSLIQARVHSVFAVTAGFALMAGILWVMINSPDNWVIHLAFLILITAISIAFGLAENETIPIGKGIIQRILYLVSFIWMVFLWK